jgi:ferredoxin
MACVTVCPTAAIKVEQANLEFHQIVSEDFSFGYLLSKPNLNAVKNLCLVNRKQSVKAELLLVVRSNSIMII